MWTDSNGLNLYIADQSLIAGYGQINFYLQTGCPATGYTGQLFLSGAAITGQSLAYEYAQVQYTGSLLPGQSITLNEADCSGNAITDSWSMDASLPAADVSAIIGTWATLPVSGGTLSIDQAGNITIPDIASQPDFSLCTVTGQVIALPHTLYSLTMSFSNCGAGGTEHGNTVSGFFTYNPTADALEGGLFWNNNDGGAQNVDLMLTRQ